MKEFKKTVKISQGAGDIISAVPYIKELGGEHLYLLRKVPTLADWHPYNHGGAEALIPLLEYQGFSAEVIDFLDSSKYTYDIDMDARVGYGWNPTMGDFYTWNSLFYGVYPDMSKSFLKCPEIIKKDIITFSLTPRYPNAAVSLNSLNDVSVDKIHLGTEAEFDYFRSLYPDMRNVYHTDTDDFLEAAKMIKSSRFFISNQCGLSTIAEGLAQPRVLIVCKEFPSVSPRTPLGRPVITQRFFDKCVEELLTITNEA